MKYIQTPDQTERVQSLLSRLIARQEWERATRVRDAMQDRGLRVPVVGTDDVSPGMDVMAALYDAMLKARP